MAEPVGPFQEEAWISGLKAGDEGAFRQIYQHFWSSLYAVSYNYLRDQPTAEELVQELFTSLWFKRQHLTIRSSLQAYLFTAIRHQIYDYLDKQSVRQRVHQQLMHEGSEVVYTTDEVVDYRELEALLALAVGQLPQPAQTIFRMSRFEYQTTQDIAKQLNLSAKTIEYHLTKALRLLRLQLKDFVLILFCLNDLLL